MAEIEVRTQVKTEIHVNDRECLTISRELRKIRVLPRKTYLELAKESPEQVQNHLGEILEISKNVTVVVLIEKKGPDPDRQVLFLTNEVFEMSFVAPLKDVEF